MAATEEPEVFLGTLMEYSEFQLSKLETALDLEEMEQRLRESVYALKPYEISESEESEEHVAIGSASTERETSADARTQKQQQLNRPTKIDQQKMWRLARLAGEIILTLILLFSVLNGAFTSPPSEVFSQQPAQENVGFVPTQFCCPDQPVRSCYIFEVLDVYDGPCMNEEESEERTTQNQYWQYDYDDQEDRQDSQQLVPQEDVSTLRVILSTASGQVHHIAFAFVNIPFVHGCALRHFRR